MANYVNLIRYSNKYNKLHILSKILVVELKLDMYIKKDDEGKSKCYAKKIKLYDWSAKVDKMREYR